MLNKVTEWKMTEAERLAYIEKHPIKPYKKETEYVPDFKWRSQKAADASKKAREIPHSTSSHV